MDDFERAVLIMFDESGASSPELKGRAKEYCDALKSTANSSHWFLQRVNETSHATVRFWCLAAVQENVQTGYMSMVPEEKLAIKKGLVNWLQRPVVGDGTPLASFLRNKVAQLIVQIVQVEYPKEWPSFFQDLIAMLAEGPEAVDMFCRVLTAIDQDVVSREIARSSQDAQRSTLLKDAMRDTCLKELTEACLQLVANLRSSNPVLVGSVLDALSRYVNWIDISLVANERFVPLLYSLLQTEQEELQGGALDVLTEIVNKRMDAEAKLSLLQQLNLGPMLSSWRQELPGDSVGELPLKAARLLTAVCNEVLDAWKKVENAMVSMSSVGLSVDSDATKEAEGYVVTSQGLICELFPALMAAVRNEDDDVRLAPLQFLQAYANKLKNTKKQRGSISEGQLQQIDPIFQAVAVCVQYPEDSPALSPQGYKERQDWEATLEIMSERRSEFFQLFKNVAKLHTEKTTIFLRQQLEQKMTAQSSFQEVEVAISLLYEAGEGANEEMIKPGCGYLGQLALGLMQVDVPHSKHRLVALAMMETYIRFSKVLAQYPESLKKALAFLLGEHGISHPDEGVGIRACYLLCRLIKAVRSSLRPFIPELLLVLQPLLNNIATTPRPEPPTATKSAPGSASVTDDRLYTHEAAGLLAGGEDNTEEQQLAYLSTLMQPLLAQIEQYLPMVSSVQQHGSIQNGHARQDPVGMLLQALEGLNRLTKGLTLPICTVKRPAVGKSLASPLHASLKILQGAPTNRALRLRVISFLHRMVECLGPQFLPYCPDFLSALLQSTPDKVDLMDVFTLVHQLITRYKGTLHQLLLSVMPEIVSRVHQHLPAGVSWSGKTSSEALSETVGEEAREREELQKAYLVLLNAAANNELASVLIQMNGSSLDLVLQALVAGASGHVDTTFRKYCFQVLKQVVSEIGKGGSVPEGYQQFVLQLAGPVCLTNLLSSGLDVRDAAVNSMLQDVASLLQLLGQQGGKTLIDYLANQIFPPLPLPQQLQAEILKGIEASDMKQLKTSLRAFLQSAPNAPPGSKVASRRQNAANGVAHSLQGAS